MQCIDSFLYVHTFLPFRCLLAIWSIIWQTIITCFGYYRQQLFQHQRRASHDAKIYDLLKGIIWILSIYCLIMIDANRIYHILKSQSIIKLYIFYNMLDMGNRLLSAFGQDTIDALAAITTEFSSSSTTTEKKHFYSKLLNAIGYVLFAFIYVLLHSTIILFQAIILNVAINSNSNGLFGILRTNNFVELKLSVFKIQDKNNLFQLSCNDVRERVHLSVLLIVVMIQTMNEYDWDCNQFISMLPDCFVILIVEFVTDWFKHIFIIRFNEIPFDAYQQYRISLAYDMIEARKTHAISDHSDLLARRMGFVSFPLSVVLIKTIYACIDFDTWAAVILCFCGILTLFLLRVLNTIIALGLACNFVDNFELKNKSKIPIVIVNGTKINQFD